jgi:hypothetical protein
MPHDPNAVTHVAEVLGPMTIGQDVWEGGLKVIEECAEVQHEMVKLCAFPSGECPDTDPRPLPERIESELGDLLGAIDFFIERNADRIRWSEVRLQRAEKYERFVRWADQARTQ